MVAKSQVLFQRNQCYRKQESIFFSTFLFYLSIALHRQFNRFYSIHFRGEKIFESSIFEQRNLFLSHGSHEPVNKAHKFSTFEYFQEQPNVIFPVFSLS